MTEVARWRETVRCGVQVPFVPAWASLGSPGAPFRDARPFRVPNDLDKRGPCSSVVRKPPWNASDLQVKELIRTGFPCPSSLLPRAARRGFQTSLLPLPARCHQSPSSASVCGLGRGQWALWGWNLSNPVTVQGPRFDYYERRAGESGIFKGQEGGGGWA